MRWENINQLCDVVRETSFAIIPRSHALRGNARPGRSASCGPTAQSGTKCRCLGAFLGTQSVQDVRSHAERGNEAYLQVKKYLMTPMY